MTEETAETIHQGAGAFLKEQRERLGLSISDVATKLKMVEQNILNIEADNYVDIPMTFYKGYLKNYAHLLELDDSVVMEKFAQFAKEKGLEDQPKTPYKRISMEVKPEKQYGKVIGKIFGFIILALFIYSVYFLLFEKGYWNKFMQTFDRSDTSSASIDSSEGTLDTSNSLELPLNNDAALPLNPQPSVNNANASSDSDGSLSLNLSDDSDSALNSSNEIPLNDTGNNVVENNAGSLNPQPTLMPESSSNSAVGAGLQITYNDKSWVKITDATGKVLAIGIKKAGHVSQLNGQAPYQLTIGDAGAVDISYQGKKVDLSSYTKGKMAKLTLGS